MLKKKLMAVAIATVFTLSSLTTTVFAADFNKSITGATVKLADPGKNESKGHGKIDKDLEKLFKFIDSKDVSWACNAIERLAGKGIINGFGFGRFAPNEKVTHLEALAMVFRLTGDDDDAERLNNQVHALYRGKKTVWGQGNINLAIEKGILLDEELEDFNPNTPAKRHEIAKYIIRALDEDNTNKAEKYMDEDLSFKDAKDIPDESVGYVYMISDLEIMIGDKNNKFNPMTPVTRAEMAVLLDRAEGKFDIPDTDKKKSGIVFVSADEDDNEITVTVKGVTSTYEYLDDVSVYKNNILAEIDDLVKGDVLKIYFNSSKKVIFIEVTKNIADEESDITFTTVSYNSLPEVLQDEVDDLKSTENYKAYEYNDYIYLLATMGKKNTGGYDIDIEKLSKVEDDDEYTVTAVVYSDEPSSREVVSQSDTYPYSIVRFKSFDDIENVIFVDEDEDELDDVKIEVVSEVSSVEGEIYDLISSSRKITVEKSNGTKVTYTVPTDAEIEVNSEDDAEFSDLEEGMIVELTIVDDEVTEIDAEDTEDEVTEVKGTITSINTSNETIDVKQSNGKVVTLTIPDDAEITVNSEEDEDFSDLEKGMKVEVELVNDEVTEVIAEDTIVKVTGEVIGLSSIVGNKITLLVSGNNKVYTVASTVDIVSDGDDKDFDDINMHDDLILTFENGTLVKIEIE